MNPERFRWLRTKCSRLFRRSRQEAALDAELRFHFDQLVAEFRAEGLSEAEARLAAKREFGGTDLYREEIRDTWRPPQLADLWRTLRLAVRSLARSPGFTILAIVTLGLGIGANTAMFTMVNGLLFEPLPFPDLAQLERVYRVTPQNRSGNLSPADFLDVQRAKENFGDTAAYTPANVSLSEPGHPADFAYAGRCTVNLFSLFGVRPQLGRDFLPEEEVPGLDRVVILSQRVWRNRYGATPDIVGRTIRIDGEPHRVVGVLPLTFNDWRHLGMIDLFRPLALTPEQAADRSSPILRVVLRRSAAHSRAEVAGFIENFGERQAASFPAVNADTSWRTAPLQETINPASAAPMLNLMLILSGLVLLIACSNLANLLLARTMTRARELAVHAALGASRTQLLRPLVAESLLLALAGGACAIVFALWFRDYMAVRTTGNNGEQIVVDIGWPVFGWALAAALVTAVAFSLAPALFALRLDLNHTLKSGGRGMTGGRGHQRFRHILIVGQFAVAMILLAAAGVQIRGLNELNSRRAGWESDHLVTGTVLLPEATYSDAERITAFHRLALERLAALPGVATVSVSSFTPFFNWTDTRKFAVADQPPPPSGREPLALVNSVTAAYFDTYGTRLLAGRAFTEQDTATSPRVFIVSNLTARALFGTENPIGRRIAQVDDGYAPRWGEIVGVVSDVKSAVTDRNPVTSQIYQPMAQAPGRQNEIAVRTNGVVPAAVVESVRSTMASLDPDLPVRQLQHVDLTIERANYQVAVGRDIFTAMGVLGLGLASLGIYGVIARTMAQRSGEFAIRLALGANLRNITGIVLASGVKLALIGSALGLFGAIGVCRLLAAFNPNMRMNSPLVLTASTLLLVAVALLASYLPARRAAAINPTEALRAE